MAAGSLARALGVVLAAVLAAEMRVVVVLLLLKTLARSWSARRIGGTGVPDGDGVAGLTSRLIS